MLFEDALADRKRTLGELQMTSTDPTMTLCRPFGPGGEWCSLLSLPNLPQALDRGGIATVIHHIHSLVAQASTLPEVGLWDVSAREQSTREFAVAGLRHLPGI